ncbi:MAG: hypothetical protein NVS3B10_11570 [Polyangiales bacterium]
MAVVALGAHGLGCSSTSDQAPSAGDADTSPPFDASPPDGARGGDAAVDASDASDARSDVRSDAPTDVAVDGRLDGAADGDAASACTPTYGSFSSDKGVFPPACWRAYGDASPFNQAIPRGVKLLPGSRDIVRRVFSDSATFGSGFADVQFSLKDPINDYGHAVYFSDATDPVYKVHCTEPWGTCALEGREVHIPAKAKPAGGSDHHLGLVDQTGTTEFDLWGAEIFVDATGVETSVVRPAGGGVIDTRWGGLLPIDGSGLGGAATAAGFGLLAGQIRPEELAAGVIDHGFFTGMRCGSASAVYPATKHDVTCADTTNAPPMGARFFLDYTDDEIAALAVPALNKIVLRAIAKYGIYFGDTGDGANVMGVGLLDTYTYTVMGFPDPMVELAKANGIPYAGDRYRWNLDGGVDWAGHLQIVDPCFTEGTGP